MSTVIRRGRRLIGVLLKDWWRYHRALSAADGRWLQICNRYERVSAEPGGIGVRCEWKWTSVLHAPTVLPGLGTRLMRRALEEYPIRIVADPSVRGMGTVPEVSFIIGHRGVERQRHLALVLGSIAAQRAARVECIVVEQSDQAEVRDRLPGWVRYEHTPLPYPGMPYSRSRALNVGARLAQANLLVFHDGDLLVPEMYAAQLLEKCRLGYEVINLKRFIFYLSETHTQRIFDGTAAFGDLPPESVVQNFEAGGSVGVDRDAYFTLGGFDEEFVGWGGEDNEFWERAATRKVYNYGYMPFIHLWHPSQPDLLKGSTRFGTRRYQEVSQEPPEARIARLRSRAFGAR